MKLTIPPSRVTGAFALVVALLIALSLLEQLSKYYPQYGYSCCFVPGFYVDQESSYPTYYSVAALAFCGMLLGFIAMQQPGRGAYRGHWAALAVIFFCLAFDERAMFHERTIIPLRNLLGLGGIFHFAWVLPGMAFVAIVGVAYNRKNTFLSSFVA